MKRQLKKRTIISTLIIAAMVISATLLSIPALFGSSADATGSAGPMSLIFSASPSQATVGSYVTVVASVDVPTTANPIYLTMVRFLYDNTKLELASHSSVGTAFNSCSYTNDYNTGHYPQYACYSYTNSLYSGTVAIATFRVIAPGSSVVTNYPIANPATDNSTSSYAVSLTPVTITTYPDEITSDTFGHTIDDTYVQSIAQYATAGTVKTQFDNLPSDLQIWDAADTNQLPDTTQAATGQILKLMVNGLEKDRKIVIVKGDINGDSLIDTNDDNILLNHVSGNEQIPTLSTATEAADIDSNGRITMVDYSRLLYHVNGITYIHPQP